VLLRPSRDPHPIAAPVRPEDAHAGLTISRRFPSPRSTIDPGGTTADSPRRRVLGAEPGTVTTVPLVLRMSVATTAPPTTRISTWVAETPRDGDGTTTSRAGRPLCTRG